jgi:hypothetical protein
MSSPDGLFNSQKKNPAFLGLIVAHYTVNKTCPKQQFHQQTDIKEKASLRG